MSFWDKPRFDWRVIHSKSPVKTVLVVPAISSPNVGELPRGFWSIPNRPDTWRL